MILKTPILHHLQAALSRVKNGVVHITNTRQVFGGDINTTFILECKEENYFVKLNTTAQADMFLKEREGLVLLRSAKTILKIPEPLLHGDFEQSSFLLMEYLEKGNESKNGWQQLATGLAQLHQTTQADFGLHYDNYIGSLKQSNTPANNWTVFYTQRRIMPLVKEAFDQHKCSKEDIQLAERFCNKLSALIPEEPPALLHGDLWSGNRMFTVNEEAAIYDPSVYFGHREMDISMTLLFGGFDVHFYNTYNEVYPLQPGWKERVPICQLYPLLVHLLLFRGHYYNRVKDILTHYA